MSSTKNNGVIVAAGDDPHAMQRLVEELQRAQRADHQTIERLERTIAQLQGERDQCLQSLYAWSRNNFPPDQLKTWATEVETGEPFAAVLAELTNSKSS
ncbi:MAG: hypothetical protein HYX68_13140 [Planctomycetes bacterium]|nr:hypothetical protein [Planctomycetota bacterium]